MKKIFMVLVMVSALFCGCGKKENSDVLLSGKLKGDASVTLKLCGKKHTAGIPSGYCLCIQHIGRNSRPPMQIKTQAV